jgi:hypothetical protein
MISDHGASTGSTTTTDGRGRGPRACAPQILCTLVTSPSLPAGIHGANHQASDAPRHAAALACGAGVLAVAPAMMDVAAGSLAPGPCQDDRCYHAPPTHAADVAGGFRSERS